MDMQFNIRTWKEKQKSTSQICWEQNKGETNVTVNWEKLFLKKKLGETERQFEWHDLDWQISDNKVREAIMVMPKEKAPDPERFH